MTLGSVGWNIYCIRSLPRWTSVETYKIIHFEITMNDTPHPPLSLIFRNTPCTLCEIRSEFLRSPYLASVHAFFRPRFRLSFGYA